MKSLFSALLAGLLLLALLSAPALAITPGSTPQGAFLHSTYHKNLLNLPRTGDLAFDTVAVALSQLGYHEGNSTADLAGKRTSGTGNFTEYNRAFGKIGGTYGYAWCATFASWCLSAAGALDLAGGGFASCTLWVERLQSLGLYRTRASGYLPSAGDLIFFRSAGVGRASDHVGIVRFVKEGRVYTVEGNSSDAVSLRDYALGNTYIVGYGRPNYRGERLPKSFLELEDTAGGWYTVTNSYLNVRSAPRATAALQGTLSRGDLLQVSSIENGWGRVVYRGKTAYISLDYADFTSPSLIRIRYTSEGECTNMPADVTYFSFEKQHAAGTAPRREGYLFVTWQAASGERFSLGDALPGEDLLLTAVWEVLPPDGEESAPPQDEPTPPAPQPPLTPDETPEAGGEGSLAITPQNDRATVAAGIASGLLATALGGAWLRQREDLRKKLLQIIKKAK